MQPIAQTGRFGISSRGSAGADRAAFALAIKAVRQDAARKGVSRLSLREVNAEIAAVRRERSRKAPVAEKFMPRRVSERNRAVWTLRRILDVDVADLDGVGPRAARFDLLDRTPVPIEIAVDVADQEELVVIDVG